MWSLPWAPVTSRAAEFWIICNSCSSIWGKPKSRELPYSRNPHVTLLRYGLKCVTRREFTKPWLGEETGVTKCTNPRNMMMMINKCEVMLINNKCEVMLIINKCEEVMHVPQRPVRGMPCDVSILIVYVFSHMQQEGTGVILTEYLHRRYVLPVCGEIKDLNDCWCYGLLAVVFNY